MPSSNAFLAPPPHLAWNRSCTQVRTGLLRAAAALAAAWLSCCNEGERPDAPMDEPLVGLRALVGEEAREEAREEVREASRDARRAAAAAARASFSSTSLMSFSSQLRNSWASWEGTEGRGEGCRMGGEV